MFSTKQAATLSGCFLIVCITELRDCTCNCRVHCTVCTALCSTVLVDRPVVEVQGEERMLPVHCSMQKGLTSQGGPVVEVEGEEGCYLYAALCRRG